MCKARRRGLRPAPGFGSSGDLELTMRSGAADWDASCMSTVGEWADPSAASRVPECSVAAGSASSNAALAHRIIATAESFRMHGPDILVGRGLRNSAHAPGCRQPETFPPVDHRPN